MDRRAFLTWVGISWLASSLPVAIAACSNKTNESSQTTASSENKGTSNPGSQNDGFVEVGTVENLNKTGSLIHKKVSGKSVLVVQAPTTSNTLYAIDAACTHQGCEVYWRAEDRRIFCPCHGSAFNPDGTVVSGPASRPLKRYEVKVEGKAVLVKAN
jgi:cytochrome b6-f complex iron-sulfur subunit